MVKKPRWNAIRKPKSYADRLTEKERIDFIRKYGSEQQKDGLKSILKYPHRNNCYTIKEDRKMMWKDRLNKGRRMVQSIIEKKIGEHIETENT